MNDVTDNDAGDKKLEAEVIKERIGRHFLKLFPQHSQVPVLVNLKIQKIWAQTSSLFVPGRRVRPLWAQCKW